MQHNRKIDFNSENDSLHVRVLDESGQVLAALEIEAGFKFKVGKAGQQFERLPVPSSEPVRVPPAEPKMERD